MITILLALSLLTPFSNITIVLNETGNVSANGPFLFNITEKNNKTYIDIKPLQNYIYKTEEKITVIIKTEETTKKIPFLIKINYKNKSYSLENKPTTIVESKKEKEQIYLIATLSLLILIIVGYYIIKALAS